MSVSRRHTFFPTLERISISPGFAVVHMMLDDTRQRYELEKLWTLGPKYDDQTISMLADRPSPPF